MSGSSAEERIVATLERIARAAGLEAEVVLTEDESGLRAEYRGDGLEVLVGNHGQTIDAIQHLAYRIAFRGATARRSLTVDAAGYRERRAAALRAAADSAAAAALGRGRPVPLAAMSSLERKVVHEYLRDRHDVETHSEGEEPNRHLVVSPLVS